MLFKMRFAVEFSEMHFFLCPTCLPVFVNTRGEGLEKKELVKPESHRLIHDLNPSVSCEKGR